MTEDQRTYNFFLSQMRIMIECAFGRLTTKWRVFRRDLDYDMPKNAKICAVAAKLHNFVINQGIADDAIEPHPAASAQRAELGYAPTNPSLPDGPLIPDPENPEEEPPTPGTSVRRETFLHFIRINGMARPSHNVARNG